MVDLLNTPIAPFLRSNADLYNFFGRPREVNRECGDLELDALECLEAYGARRGTALCASYVSDFRECATMVMQKQRVNVMKRERLKQVIRGERKFFEAMDTIKPPTDSFQSGPFYN